MTSCQRQSRSLPRKHKANCFKREIKKKRNENIIDRAGWVGGGGGRGWILKTCSAKFPTKLCSINVVVLIFSFCADIILRGQKIVSE